MGYPEWDAAHEQISKQEDSSIHIMGGQNGEEHLLPHSLPLSSSLSLQVNKVKLFGLYKIGE